MKKFYLSAIAVLISTQAYNASAQDNWSLGIIKSDLRQSSDSNYVPFDIDTFGFTLGYGITDNISIEGRLTTSTDHSKIDFGQEGLERSEDIKRQGSIFIKMSIPIYNNFSAYGLAGYANTKFSSRTPRATFDENNEFTGSVQHEITRKENGLSYGLGLNYQMDNKINIFIEHQVMEVDYLNDWKSTNIGVSYHF